MKATANPIGGPPPKNSAAPTINQVAVVGRICSVQKRDTSKGSVCNIRLAVVGRNRSTHFLTAHLWYGVNNAFPYLQAGRLLGITGSLTSRQWKAKDGSSREAVAINIERYYFLDRPRTNEGVS